MECLRLGGDVGGEEAYKDDSSSSALLSSYASPLPSLVSERGGESSEGSSLGCTTGSWSTWSGEMPMPCANRSGDALSEIEIGEVDAMGVLSVDAGEGVRGVRGEGRGDGESVDAERGPRSKSH